MNIKDAAVEQENSHVCWCESTLIARVDKSWLKTTGERRRRRRKADSRLFLSHFTSRVPRRKIAPSAACARFLGEIHLFNHALYVHFLALIGRENIVAAERFVHLIFGRIITMFLTIYTQFRRVQRLHHKISYCNSGMGASLEAGYRLNTHITSNSCFICSEPP